MRLDSCSKVLPSSKPVWHGVILASAVFISTFCGNIFAADGSEKVDFNFQVRPILADRCFKCHGPDEKTRKAKLRLDQPESAYAVRDPQKNRRAVVPFHPEQSELVRRITTTDEDDRMPPAASNLTLTDEEREVLRRWVVQGGEYKPHWAFIPVHKPVVPALKKSSRARNPIDAFVLDRLRHEGMKPSPEASRETLIRRLSFDLRGLPPSIAEIDEFLADKSRKAYERVVDKFLASPAYGEHLANDWLDLARFADTYGYQNDVGRDMSPWRDWVIRAFNANLSWDKFVTWQLAGDLLPNATAEQKLATAFCRNHPINGEGGRIAEENRIDYVMDMTETAGTVWLGLTLNCCRCHDHKFDPLAQREYYSLFAFFNQTPITGGGGAIHAMSGSPLLSAWSGRRTAISPSVVDQASRRAAPKECGAQGHVADKGAARVYRLTRGGG